MKILKFLLAISALEGVGVFYALLQIPTDPKNSWLMGLSKVRWLAVLLTIAGIIILGILVIKSWRNSKWFSNVTTQLVDKFNQRNLCLGICLKLFFTFTLLYTSGLLIPLLYPMYAAAAVRLAPLVVWALLLILQSLIGVLYMYFTRAREIIAPPVKKINIPKMAIRLFIISVVIRAVLAVVVISAEVPPEFDEAGYYGRALGIEGIFNDLASGAAPSTDNLNSAYGDGRWPPFHPMILAIGLFIFGSKVASARIMMVILSSLTTPLVYLLSKKITNHRVGIYAAIVHIIYPSFLAYSHFLWSETTFIFLLLLSTYTLVLSIESQDEIPKILLAAACGLFLGFGALTRSAMLPYIAFVPVWLLFANKRIRWKIISPLVVLSMVVITFLPWIITQTLVEGQPTLLGTNGGYTLYLSNNSWLPEEEYGSSMEFRSTRDRVRQSIEDFKQANGVSDSVAADILAREEISQNFTNFIWRSLERARYLISSDSFIVRHFVHAVYPPVSDGVVVGVWVGTLVGSILLYSFTSFGFFSNELRKSHRNLIILLALVGMALPIITIANSRYYLPVFATLLPVTGVGIGKFLDMGGRKKMVWMVSAVTTFSILVLTTLPNFIQNNLRPSIYYSDLVGKIDSFFGGQPEYSDRFWLRNPSGEADVITVSILSEGYLFRWNETETLEWQFSEIGGEERFDIYSTSPVVPLKIMITSEGSGKSITIYPVSNPYWHQWVKIGNGGIEIRWVGGGF